MLYTQNFMHLNKALSSPDSRIVSFLYANSSLDFVQSRTSLFVHFTFLLRIIYVALRRGLAKQRRQRRGEPTNSAAVGPRAARSRFGPTRTWPSWAQPRLLGPMRPNKPMSTQRLRPSLSEGSGSGRLRRRLALRPRVPPLAVLGERASESR